MTQIYLLIEAGDILDESTNFYFVNVGTSRHAQYSYRSLLSLCQQRNWYFKLRDADVSQFLRRIFTSIPNHRPVIKCDVCDMIRNFKQGTRPPLSPAQVANQKRMDYYFNLSFRVACNAQAEHVKNQK